MYEIVDNEKKQQEFNRIWKECRNDKGYEVPLTSADRQQYIIYAGNLPAGIIEFTPFTPEVDKIFPFSDDEQVKKNIESVYEMKMDILKEYKGIRGKDVLPEMVSVIVEFFEEKNVSSLIGFIEPPLHFVLKTIFKLPIEKVGKKLKHNGGEVLPVCLYGLKKGSR
jgi:hypothetical protein